MTRSLYAGTITDYFSAALRQQTGSAPERDEVRARVDAWRKYLSDGLMGTGHLVMPLLWSEDEQELFKHQLGPDSLQALRLFLVHGIGSVDAPDELPTFPEEHPKWKEAVADDFQGTGFDQILVPELWLPGDFDFTFDCPYPDGHEVQAGSLGALRTQLNEVGRMRLPTTESQREEFDKAVPTGRNLETLARFAYVALERSCNEALDRGLPLLVHE